MPMEAEAVDALPPLVFEGLIRAAVIATATPQNDAVGDVLNADDGPAAIDTEPPVSGIARREAEPSAEMVSPIADDKSELTPAPGVEPFGAALNTFTRTPSTLFPKEGANGDTFAVPVSAAEPPELEVGVDALT